MNALDDARPSRARNLSAPRAWLAALVLASLCLAGCDRSAPARAPGPTRILVSIAPLSGLVRSLAPDAQISVLVPAGVSEHGYELSSGDIARIRQADLIVGVGLGLEPRLAEVIHSLPPAERRILWFADILEPGTRSEPHPPDDGHDHHSHDEHDHAPHSVDPHLWLDPILVEQFVPVLAGAIASADRRAGLGASADAVQARSESLISRVEAIHDTAQQRLAPLAGRAIVTHHSSHGRFAERYGLRIAATIRIAETLEPTPEQVRDAVRAIQAEQVPAVFVEPQFDATTASRIAQAAGVRVVVLDPMGDGDWFALMRTTIDTIAAALGDGQTVPVPRPSPDRPTPTP